MRYLLIIVLCLAFFSCQNNSNASQPAAYEDNDTSAVVEGPANYEVRDSGVPDNSSNLNTVQAATASQTPQWEDYGAVELWTYYKSNEITYEDGQYRNAESYKLSKTGEGRVYVKHSINGDLYELRYTDNTGNNYSYHVAIGNFTVETDDGIMQFTAHAGPHYFDL